ncbi:MAG TPA: AsmA-like C-terminal region-containing protein [Bacteroidia bacterium]|nr:AsmA-like C-terminal region-containing protein [Bacteroidia bacterium]HRS57905.1 AsmA-like C-terminal region-containing protein [Bacteroidia bacterium]HRU68286.1 AsmA-like C-terminal region-containing protein [Bacteroidia bacterium]
MTYRKVNTLLLSLIALLSLSSVFFLYLMTFQEDFAKILNKQLKNYISSPYQIGTAHISPFRNFPNIAILAKDVIIYENPQSGNKPLITINKLYLQLDFWSFFRKNFIVEKLEIDEVAIQAYIDQNGITNFNVLTSSDQKSGDFDLDLNKIILKNTRLNFLSEKDHTSFKGNFEKLQLKGKLQSEEFNMVSKLNGEIISFYVDSIRIFNNTPIAMNADIQVNTSQNLYKINHFTANLDETSWLLSGQLKGHEKMFLDLKLNSDNINLAEAIRILPVIDKDTLSNFEFNGKVSFKSTIKGMISDTALPEIKINFNFADAAVRIIDKDILFNKINLSGNFSNAGFANHKNGRLTVDRAEVFHQNTSLNLKLSADDLIHPFIRMECQSTLEPDILALLGGLDEFKNISGKLDFNIKVNGYMDSLKSLNFNQSNIRINLALKELSFRYDDYDIKKLSGTVHTEENDYKILVVNSLSGIFDQTDFKMSGKIQNYLSLLDSSGKPAALNIKLNAGSLTLDKYLKSESSGNNDQSEGYKSVVFPEKILYLADIEVVRLKYQNFTAENVKARLKYLDNEISVSDARLTTAKGKLSGYGKIFPSGNDKFQVDGIVHVSDMEIKEIFREMDNFDQDYITDRHLSGITDGNLQFSLKFDYLFIPDEASLFCLADVVVRNGNIRNFEPLIDLFGFVRMKKLEDVKFDKLENTILIKERVITIPYMNVSNTAFNIALSGTHTFDNHIDYYFKVNLTDLFFKRYNRNITEFEASEKSSNGGINIYLNMTGTVDDYKLKYEQAKAKEAFIRNENIKKTELKEKIKTPRKENQQEMEFYWENE